MRWIHSIIFYLRILHLVILQQYIKQYRLTDMPKFESPFSPGTVQMTPYSRNKTDKILNGLFISDKKQSAQQPSTIKSQIKVYTPTDQQNRELLINFNPNDIMESYTEIVDQNIQTKFKLRFYVLEIILACGLIIALNFLTTLYYLPYFLMVAIYGFFHNLSPYKLQHLLIFISYAFLLGNVFLDMEFLSYPTILIIYLSVAVFQKQNTIKNLVIVLSYAGVFLYAFILLPLLQDVLNSIEYGSYIYIYLFPIVDIIAQLLLDILYFVINEPRLMYYPAYIFLLGIYFGTSMSLSIASTQFWYMCIAMTLKITNGRTQFLMGYFKKKLVRLAFLNLLVQKKTLSYKNGYILKLIPLCTGIIYLYSYFNWNNPPFSSLTLSMILIYNSLWYQPLILAGTIMLYEWINLRIDSQIKQKKKILLEIQKPKIIVKIEHAIVDVFALWLFYVGYLVKKQWVSG